LFKLLRRRSFSINSVMKYLARSTTCLGCSFKAIPRIYSRRAASIKDFVYHCSSTPLRAFIIISKEYYQICKPE
jgi:hypothetical protein